MGLIFGTAELRFTAEGVKDLKGTLCDTSVYVNRDGELKFLALQMTGLADRRDP